MLHNTLAFSAEVVALGLGDGQCWARDPQEFGRKKTRHQRPIQDKESQKWLGSLQVCQQQQESVPHPPSQSRRSGNRHYELLTLLKPGKFFVLLSVKKAPGMDRLNKGGLQRG
jgi:hypothetical protein